MIFGGDTDERGISLKMGLEVCREAFMNSSCKKEEVWNMKFEFRSTSDEK